MNEKSEFSSPQSLLILIVHYAEKIVIKLSVGLFVPDWTTPLLLRLRRNNALISQRQDSE